MHRSNLILTLLALGCGAASANPNIAEAGGVLVDEDFGLTLEVPAGFQAELIGQTPDGAVVINAALAETDPANRVAADPLCEIAFSYDPTFGQGDQEWVNSLVDETGFYERMAQESAIPGTVRRHLDFTHRGALAHRFFGELEQGGSFSVSAIPSPEGYVIASCVSSDPDRAWDDIVPLIDAITIPGQPRDHLVGNGTCDRDPETLNAQLGKGRQLDADAIADLDAERISIAQECGFLNADALMDAAVAEAGYDATYRALRYETLAEVGASLLTEEQHAALDGGREQVVATADAATGERYLRYMHFIVGLRSLD
jgi:hypothetical protein